ncbi:MAG TPA: hypothetical protein VIO85_05800 [Candidatus Dormibacteraeota bacterium]
MDHILPYLFFLACPISMGLMMWMMMRRDHNHASAPQSDPRVAELESQVGELRMALHQRQSVETAASVTPNTNADRE